MSPGSVTGRLLAWKQGDEAALADLAPAVHGELLRIARRCLRGERRGVTLSPTALINEAYLRLVDVQRVNWQGRAHFLAMAARIMRRILVEAARARRRQKRGGGGVQVTLTDEMQSTDTPHDLVALDDALEALAVLDRRRSRVVELRFFGGLTVDETAAVLGISAETAMRDWKLARAWLRRELRRGGSDDV
jgi:RNA polymerase sigma factor (TIGR02999 family)